MMHFQAKSKYFGDAFEDMVLQDLSSSIDVNNITKNYSIPLTGCEVDFAFQNKGVSTYVEAKGGFQKLSTRPGARRTDNVKKAVANAALIKHFQPDCKYIVYFSDVPKHGSSSYQMLQTAIMAGFIDQIIYLIKIN